MFFEKKRQGYITISVIVFGAVFAIILTGLLGFVFVQNTAQSRKEHKELAMQIAEAGVDRYRWLYNHCLDGLTHANCPVGTTTFSFTEDYSDPEGGVIGQYQVDIEPIFQCNQDVGVEVVSTGWTTEQPNTKRRLLGRYARPTVAAWAFVVNNPVWIEDGTHVSGRLQANGGVRMDGTHDSTVQSGVETWTCTSAFGCSPDQVVNGVFGDAPTSTLWQYPRPQIDFGNFMPSLGTLKTAANIPVSSGGGLYYASSSSGLGYEIIFEPTGDGETQFDIREVTNTNRRWFRPPGGSPQSDEIEIDTVGSLIGNDVLVPPDCRLIYVEDNVWISGEIGNKLTIGAGDLTSSDLKDIMLQGSLSYETGEGEDGITVFSENNILFPLDSDDVLEVNGIFVAEAGTFGRRPYIYHSTLQNTATRTSLTINGTMVSNTEPRVTWYESGAFVSGYASRTNAYDRRLATDPPPLTPIARNWLTFTDLFEIDAFQ